MSSYNRPMGSIDAKISEIPEGTYRVKIIGTIVNLSPTSLMINDGEDQISLRVNKISMKDVKVGDTGRVVAEVTKRDDRYTGTAFAWHKMTMKQIENYLTLVKKIERRIPKI